MRSHRVILRQIAQAGLDPTVPHVTSKDGRLVPKSPVDSQPVSKQAEPVSTDSQPQESASAEAEVKVKKPNPFKKKKVETPVTE